MSSEKKDTENDEFRQAMSDVRPLGPLNRIEPAPKKPPPITRQRDLDNEAVLDELLEYDIHAVTLETGEELIWRRDDVRKNVLRRLRGGRYSVRDTLDLHHMNEKTAKSVLFDFLEHAINEGFGCVRVVHGKGLRSKGAPTLKLMTAKVLRKHPKVICYASCRPVDGGTGATDVLLSVRKRS